MCSDKVCKELRLECALGGEGQALRLGCAKLVGVGFGKGPSAADRNVTKAKNKFYNSKNLNNI